MHGGEFVLRVVRVDVALAVVQLLHEARGRVADDEGHGLGDGVKRVALCAHVCHVHCVGFRRKRQINHRFRQMNAAFGHSDKVTRLIGGDGDLQRSGVGKPYVLAGESRNATCDIERIFPRLEHACEPVDRGVRVGIAHGLVKCGNDVVVFLARFIVKERLFGSALLQSFARYGDGAVVGHIAVEHRHLEGGQRGARVAVCEYGDRFDKIVRDLDLLISEPARISHRAVQQRAQVVLGKRLQHKDFAPRKQRAVHLERGVFGGCADEDYAAFFHKRQESVLLRLVETVYLVYEQNRALAETAVFLRLFHDLFYLLYAAGHGGEVDEVSLCPVGDDARKGSLAHAGRAPEYHRADIVALDESA